MAVLFAIVTETTHRERILAFVNSQDADSLVSLAFGDYSNERSQFVFSQVLIGCLTDVYRQNEENLH